MPVSACFGPVFYHGPVDSRRVGTRQALQRLLQIAESRKIFKIVCVRIKDCSLVRKVMFLCPLGDNGFQCTLNGLPHQVIAGFGMPGIQQNLCITAAQFRQFLQVISIHWLASLTVSYATVQAEWREWISCVSRIFLGKGVQLRAVEVMAAGHRICLENATI